MVCFPIQGFNQLQRRDAVGRLWVSVSPLPSKHSLSYSGAIFTVWGTDLVVLAILSKLRTALSKGQWFTHPPSAATNKKAIQSTASPATSSGRQREENTYSSLLIKQSGEKCIKWLHKEKHFHKPGGKSFLRISSRWVAHGLTPSPLPHLSKNKPKKWKAEIPTNRLVLVYINCQQGAASFWKLKLTQTQSNKPSLGSGLLTMRRTRKLTTEIIYESAQNFITLN